MHYRRLGSTGLQLSVLSFGTWVTFGNQVARDEARNLVACAWDHGVNFFDGAETYAQGRAEQVLGDVIADLRLPRDGYCVSSKVFFGAVNEPRPTQCGLSRKHVHDACHAALKRLRVDYLDLFFCHRPDADTPIEETVRAMTTLIRQGKVLYWGTSEWSAAQIAEAIAIASREHLERPWVEQPQYNLLHRERVEREYVSLYAQGLGTTIWSPLASGLLTGKHNVGVASGSRLVQPGYEWLQRQVLGEGEARLVQARRFSEVAADLGQLPTQLAIAWCLRNPHVSTVILGASRVAQLKENLQALQVVAALDAAAWRCVEAAME
ncbi:aldo/keto reductase [Xylella fastidiosa subsp. fastidiosa]|uniref:Voltage-gated potassium channel beta subunit n=3 Tax=Xylella fastidiosa TaxID=2371 RepID=Q87AW6_XYLFT|nr:aldo/keto reductase [Xylella fastidiosa]ADN62554.1 aldo/keto reductase [Xylella fastidiosa subsp. fastidiosa GB514]KAF0571316.1 NADP-dependent aryl-alcohol dehydrogenase [Xylella fastidiosa subsp. fastidiosa Mus-1]AAO29535.1 voltage-gated potassium channel beta subunit [Xylella fastidiosa Temecula1]ACB93194.1 aldo/keto reductase [Xylella fastidiosa M23]EGO81643.1 oxidoreductase [Xylella fastidiosa EB92.1]